MDEKTGIQALDRPQPILPMRPGQVERSTHDYRRHGIIDLFAALNVATATSSSWLNLVERWFAELTTKILRRSAHRSVKELTAGLNQWVETWNDNPRPFVWHKPPTTSSSSSKKYLTNF